MSSRDIRIAMYGYIAGVFLTLASIIFVGECRGDTLKMEAHEPNYIIRTTGNKENNLRFQFSFRTRFVQQLYFAYTQRSIWRVWEPSAPITDSDYNPSLFFWLSNIKVGYEHESNGLNEGTSRSWERIYMQGVYGLTDWLKFGYKIWEPFFLHENTNIPKYQGKGELSIVLNYKQFEVRNTTREHNNTLEFEWDLGDFNIYAQAFNGFGKNIIEYDQDSHWYGVGVSL